MPARTRLFESDFLERFTRANVVTNVVFWVGVCSALLAGGFLWGGVTVGRGIALMVAAVAIWTLFEYVMHRYLFHIDRWLPAAGRVAFLAHGVHHLEPDDAGRDIMPLALSLPIFSVLLGAGVLVAGPAQAAVFFGAFGLCYLVYDLTHYGCHQWRLPGRAGAYLKRHHLAHHYADDHSNFGVSSPLWDWVFGTLRKGRRRG